MTAPERPLDLEALEREARKGRVFPVETLALIERVRAALGRLNGPRETLAGVEEAVR